MDIFETPCLLITIDASFEHNVGPLYSPNGQTEFEVVRDRTNFIDLQNIFIELKCKILHSDSNTLRFTTGDAAASGLPIFVNNTLHSFFLIAVSLHMESKCFHPTETMRRHLPSKEFSHYREAKDTWLKGQVYSYEKSPDTFTDSVFTERQNKTKRSAVVIFIGKKCS